MKGMMQSIPYRPDTNRTTDEEICSLADSEDRVVVTKIDDFVSSFLVQGGPARLLLLVSTGNISNWDLFLLFERRRPSLIHAFGRYRFVELTRDSILGQQ